LRIDFPLVLVVLTAACGAVWAFDAVRGGRRGREASGVAEPWLVDNARGFFPILLAVLVLRSFLAEPFRIPSASMVPTLEVGDFILVNKYAYGIRLPVLDSKLVEVGRPARGDVVVFRYPPDPSQDFIKRVVGLPGDVVEYRDKTLWVNGQQVQVDLDSVYLGPDDPGARVGVEALGAVAHRLMVKPWVEDPPGRWTVPRDQYFVMGDNRDNSRDSRAWGFVPEGNLVGRAFVVWMSWRPSASMPRWERVGTRIE
jgi:signal peptidase I